MVKKKELEKKIIPKDEGTNVTDKTNLFQGKYLSLIYLLILGIVFIFIYKYIYDTKLFLGGDNAVYYITGCSIADGNGYTNIHLSDASPANHFPPGYPFIISIIVMLFGENMKVVKEANGVFFFASLFMLFLIIKDLTKNINLAFIVSLITLLNAHLLQFSIIEMSEIPFTFFMLLSIFCFIRTFNKGSTLRQPYFWILAVSIIIAFYIRSIGITLLGATLLILIINKRWMQSLVLTLCFIIAYAPWYIRSEKLGGNTYSKQITMVNPYRPELGTIKMSNYPQRFIENVKRYLSFEITSAYTGADTDDYKIPSTWKDYALSISLFLLALIGLFSQKHFRWFIFFFLSSTFLILMFWPPVWTGTRFMLPMIPLLLFMTIQGVLFIISKIADRWSDNKVYMNAAPFIFLLFIPVFIPNISLLNYSKNTDYPENYPDYFQLATWCKNNLPDTAIICTRKPELFYLYAHRKVNSYPFLSNSDDFIFYLKKEHITYVVIDVIGYSSTALYLIPAIENNLEKFKIIRTEKSSSIYRFFSDDAFGYVGERDKFGRKEGKGISHFCGGSSYVGTYHLNHRDGYGKYTYQSGNYYIGHYRNDQREGMGTIYSKDGEYITGMWKNDSLNGFAVQYDKDGKILSKGIWERNILIKAR